VDDRIDPHLAAVADSRAREHRNPRRQEDLVLDPGAVQVRVRANEHMVAEHGRMALAPP
jgi:hypothetical protein